MSKNIDRKHQTSGRGSVEPPYVSLRSLRKAAGLTLEDVAERIHQDTPELTVSRGTLSAIESGSRGASELMLQALARAFGLDSEEILVGYAPIARKPAGARGGRKPA